MIPKKYRKEFDKLIDRYRQGIASPEESRFIEDYYNSFESRPAISEQLTEEEKEAWRQTLLAKINQHIAQGEQAPVIPLYRKTWFRIAAAACIIAATSLVMLRLAKHGKVSEPAIANATDVVAPKETRAVITLADGRKVYLDSTSAGTLVMQDNVNVVKNEKGEIIYSPLTTQHAPLTVYNTLLNPRGSKVVSLTLSDGTKVWLNSESSLRYPASFSALSAFRDVEITGEAYFEVKHNAKQPFKVHLPNGSVVEDIGTAFNINSYADESDIKTTLIEGSVKVYPSSRLGALAVKPKPGEQVIDGPDAPLTIQHAPNVDDVIAWKNGLTSFRSADIKTIMRQVARWYDIDVRYEGPMPQRTFTGEIPRDVNLSELLKLFEVSNIHFDIDAANKKLTIKQ